MRELELQESRRLEAISQGLVDPDALEMVNQGKEWFDDYIVNQRKIRNKVSLKQSSSKSQ